MNIRRNLCHMGGFMLLELAIAASVIGLSAGLIWKALEVRKEEQRQTGTVELVRRAQIALDGFIFTHSRMPCAAENNEGQEACSGGNPTEGYFPFMTVGVVDKLAGRLRYSVDKTLFDSRNAANVLLPERIGHDLSARLSALATVMPPSFFDAAGMASVDVCARLVDPAQAANLAFSVTIATDDGVGFGGESVTFSRTRAELAEQMGCPGIINSAVRAHFNVAMGADANERSMEDVIEQLELLRELTAWDIGVSTTWVMAGLNSVHKAVTNEHYGLNMLIAWGNPAAFTGALLYSFQATSEFGAMMTNLISYGINYSLQGTLLEENKAIFEKMRHESDEVGQRAFYSGSSAYFLERQ